MKTFKRYFFLLFIIAANVSSVYCESPSLLLKGSFNNNLYRPVRIAINPSGEIAVADYNRRQICFFNEKFRLASSISLSNAPLSVAYSNDGNIYIGVANDILLMNHTGDVINKFSDNGAIVQSPVGIKVTQSGLVYVIDKDMNKLSIFSAIGGLQFSFGTQGTGDGEFYSPSDITLDESSEKVIIADAGNSRIQIFSLQGSFIRKFGEHIYKVDSTWNVIGTFAQIQGVTVDKEHRIYITDGGLNHLQIFDSTGTHLGFLGTESHSTSVFRVPMGVQVSANDELYITSMASSEIKIYSILSPTKVPPESNELPKQYAVGQNYPNPFNPSTEIKYSLPTESFVTLKIFDITGREVTTLLSEQKLAGTYKIIWNGKNKSGNDVSSGIYFYHFQADDKFSQTNKMLFLK
jgi:hypothetical protein